MLTTWISSFMAQVDAMCLQFTSVLFKRLGLYLIPIFWSMLTLYIVWYGARVLTLRITPTPLEIMMRLVFIGTLFFFMSDWNAFSETFYTLIQSIPEFIADRIMAVTAPLIHAEQGNSSVGIMKMFDALMGTSLAVADRIYSGSYYDLMGALLGAGIVLMTLFFTGIAVAAIAASKILLGLLIGLAPLWLVMGMFEYTRRILEGFVQTVIWFMVYQILIYGFLGLYTQFTKSASDAAVGSAGSLEAKLGAVVPLFFLLIVGFYIMKLIAQVATQLTGTNPLALSGAGGAVGNALQTGWNFVKGGANRTGNFMQNSTRGREQFQAERDAARQARARSIRNAVSTPRNSGGTIS